MNFSKILQHVREQCKRFLEVVMILEISSGLPLVCGGLRISILSKTPDYLGFRILTSM